MLHKIIVNDIKYEFEDYNEYLNFIAQRYGYNTWDEYVASLPIIEEGE